MKRPCPVNHCTNRVGSNGVMCNRCWDALPEQIQRRVQRSYWEWKDAAVLRRRHPDNEDAGIESDLHLTHAKRVRVDAINAAGFARRDQRVPAQLFGPHHRPEVVTA